ncbi:sensor histidine kinase [Arundinibacter roseus]|uniref:histidine kinase n=1 Tax=Arundinibacter roseus TaxID=2070510 RepID=A0A4R4K8I6_9BACT|nr:ATP-binding protein [Arundinibacter roseus]TDB64007.1 two-component sensor histidine kinase [Arundinibacter roseus]
MDDSNQLENLQQTNALLSDDVERLSQEMKDAQRRFEQQSKLAAMGQLMAGILHEIRNPLNFVTNFSKLTLDLLEEIKEILAKMEENSERADFEELAELIGMVEVNINRIYENGGRAERITQRMLGQTRADEQKFVPTDLNQLVEEFAKLAYQAVRGQDREFNVSFTFELDPAVGMVDLMANEFTRVIINLVNNACYAVNVKRKAGNEPDYVPRITIRTERAGNEYVTVRIRDNGIGIPEEIVQKVFNAFFTTKPPGEGTGLGLSLSMTTINDLHHGKLTVESEPNVFTEFMIWLPDHLSTWNIVRN